MRKYAPGLIVQLLLALLAAAPALAQEGGVVTSGSATITSPTPTVTQINQLTDKAIIQWDSFSIASGSSTIFNQPSSTSIALNRVIGTEASLIYGSLLANGQVWILNPNGILFGQGSTINVGALVASTLSISDTDFLSGTYKLLQDPSKEASYVVNQGSITVTSFAALVGPLVENAGSITAPGGKVYLLGASEAVLDITGDGLIGYSIGSVCGQTVNIRADALSDVVKAAVNTGGLVEAGAIVDDGSGVIRLVGAGGLAVNTGTISVGGAAGVNGGSVVLNSAQATINTYHASIDASGSGLDSNGGSILLLSNHNTYFRGTLNADAGTTGDGGFIEVSAPGHLWFMGLTSAAAPGGAGGTLVIDPTVLTITDGAATSGALDANFSADGIILTTDTAGGDTVSRGSLEAFVGATILLQATDTITMEDLVSD
ncbi:MAG TPA: filamentous hemagglutinin N-terminal domain-containing protein, partial [Planctomycetota bacterium]